MSELARKLFAESQYADAFRLSDVKTHSLSAFVREENDDEGSNAGRRGKRPPAEKEPGGVATVLRRLASGPGLAIAILVLVVAGVLVAPPVLDSGPSRAERLAAISPFLTAGIENQQEEPRRFVGTLSPTWEYVGTAERRQAVEEMGSVLASQGVTRLVLMNAHGDVVARYINGEILLLVEREAPPAEDE
jgi:hypothetical protein